MGDYGWIVVAVLAAIGVAAAGAFGYLRWREIRRHRLEESAAFRPRDLAPEPVASPTWQLEQTIERQQHDIDALKNAVRSLTEDVRALRTQLVAQKPTRAPEDAIPIRPTKRERATPERLLADYKAAADDLPAEGDKFIETWKPRGVVKATDGAGYRVDGEVREAFLWAIGEGPQVLLLPGYMALKNWRTHFTGARESTARDWFESAFDLDPASTRFEATPAMASQEDGRISVNRRGRITGFRA